MRYFSRVRYYFYAYKQLYHMYLIAFYSLITQLLYPDRHYYFLQVIMLFDNALVHNTVYDYLRLSCISTSAIYVFNILLVIFPLYLLVTSQIRLMKLLLHDNLPLQLPRVAKWHAILVCYYYYINVVCIQIVSYWGTN